MAARNIAIYRAGAGSAFANIAIYRAGVVSAHTALLETSVFIERAPVRPSQTSVFIGRASFPSTSPCSKHRYLSSGRRFDLRKRRYLSIRRQFGLHRPARNIGLYRAGVVSLRIGLLDPRRKEFESCDRGVWSNLQVSIRATPVLLSAAQTFLCAWTCTGSH